MPKLCQHLNTLLTVLHRVVSALVVCMVPADAAAGAQAAGGADGSAKADDVVDADFKEVKDAK